MDSLAGFAFARPHWLWAIPVLLVLVHVLTKSAAGSGWTRFIAADKLKFLQLFGQRRKTSQAPFFQAGFALVCVALAGPGLPGPESQTGSDRRAMIVLLDLSPSMLATDSKPSRIALAQLKLIDLLRARNNADTGLLVYAAGAHRVAPLTDDPRTIETLVPVLTPAIMPHMGSNPLAAVELAIDMFDGAEVTRGDLLLITDGIDADSAAAITAMLDSRWRMSVLAIGARDSVAVPLPDGAYLRDAQGALVLVDRQHARLRQLARDNAGQFVTLSVDNSDLELLAREPSGWLLAARRGLNNDFDTTRDVGYWLILPLLPLALWLFRRNQFWIVLVVLALPLQGRAADWQALWMNDDQRAAAALQAGDAVAASALFRDPDWAAVARFQSGDYTAAAALFAAAGTADGFYNLGNTLALQGQFKPAAAAYEQSLLLDAENRDAQFNLALVKGILESPENSENQRRQSAGSDDGDQPQQESASDPPPNQQRASDSPQQRVGGATGEGQSLAQQALQAGGQSGNRPAAPGDEISSEPANDAQPVAAPPVDGEAFDGDRPANDASPAVEDSDNRVLNPYSEQWLRELPQDPGGYLRRKFHYEAQLRAAQEIPPVMNY